MKVKKYEIMIEQQGYFIVEAKSEIDAVLKAEDEGILDSESARFQIKEVE